MPPGQVSRGQRGTGLRLLVRSWLKNHSRDSSNISNDSSGDSSSSSGSSSSKSEKSSNDNSNNSKGGDSSSSSSGNEGSPANASNGKGDSSTSSGIPKPSGSPPLSSLPPPCFGPCVPDNDPKVIYSSSWSIRAQGFFQTSHQTDVVGSWLSFNFTGSAITVFGSIPVSNKTDGPPTAAYSIDAAKPFVTAQPMANQPIINQPLFSASQLSSGMHTLLVNVTDVQSASPFSVDYFIVTPSPPKVTATSSPTAVSASAPPAVSASASAISPQSSVGLASALSKTQSSGTTVGIIAGVLGSVIFVLLGLLVLLFVILRRRRKRAQRTKSLRSSLFTTSESILMWSRTPSLHFSTASPFRPKPASEKSRSRS